MPENPYMSMRISAAFAAAVLVLSACGGSAKKSASASAESTTASTQTTPSATSSTTPTTATSHTSTTTAPGPSLCRAGNLDLSFLGQQGATGHGELGFALRNTGASSCRTGGYPGVLFLNRSGGALPTAPTHTTHDFAGQAPLVSLIVPPGGSVSFRLGVTHGVVSSAGCTTAYGLQVIPPNDTATLRVGITDGAFECRTVTVSPVRPGHTAYP
jgi:Protein of unknown function (DUF4232)